jgi:hypothetical protein
MALPAVWLILAVLILAVSAVVLVLFFKRRERDKARRGFDVLPEPDRPPDRQSPPSSFSRSSWAPYSPRPGQDHADRCERHIPNFGNKWSRILLTCLLFRSSSRSPLTAKWSATISAWR